MITRMLALVMVLAMTLALTAPALADRQDEAPDFETATPVQGYPDYETTDDGFVIYEGDMVIADCGFVQRDDFTATTIYEEVVKVCAVAGFAAKGSRSQDVVTRQTPLPETGGLPILPASIVLLVGGGVLIRTVTSR